MEKLLILTIHGMSSMDRRNKIMVDLIAGARPNFVKLASIVKAIRQENTVIKYRLIHTGQHYSPSLSDSFFEQLNLPKPDINLGAGSGTQAEQTAKIMVGYEHVLKINKPAVCIVVGDVNSTMACAIVAKKAGVKVAHIEAGIRSYDWNMPEEINRVVTDSITNWFFTTSQLANKNLLSQGINSDNIFFVGNTMIDTLLDQSSKFCRPDFWFEYNLTNKNYIVLTLHRPANVDDPNNLLEILKTIDENTNGMQVIFPVHPRTNSILDQLEMNLSFIKFVPPQGYLEFNYLVKNSFAVITDSGGISEEATIFNVPCLTMRDNTERPETIDLGTNELVGTNPTMLPKFLKILFDGNWKDGSIPPKWDGNTGSRIIKIIHKLLEG
jgi:UDP-N-acetylglucosamine 2-epimerase (non-hydrolysing)